MTKCWIYFHVLYLSSISYSKVSRVHFLIGVCVCTYVCMCLLLGFESSSDGLYCFLDMNFIKLFAQAMVCLFNLLILIFILMRSNLSNFPCLICAFRGEFWKLYIETAHLYSICSKCELVTNINWGSTGHFFLYRELIN